MRWSFGGCVWTGVFPGAFRPPGAHSREDKKLIVAAAAQAQKTADLILGRSQLEENGAT